MRKGFFRGGWLEGAKFRLSQKPWLMGRRPKIVWLEQFRWMPSNHPVSTLSHLIWLISALSLVEIYLCNILIKFNLWAITVRLVFRLIYLLKCKNVELGRQTASDNYLTSTFIGSSLMSLFKPFCWDFNRFLARKSFLISLMVLALRSL